MSNSKEPIRIQPYQVPREGSLGLLALGAKGLQAWRKEILGLPQETDRIIGPIVLGRELGILAKKEDEKK